MLYIVVDHGTVALRLGKQLPNPHWRGHRRTDQPGFCQTVETLSNWLPVCGFDFGAATMALQLDRDITQGISKEGSAVADRGQVLDNLSCNNDVQEISNPMSSASKASAPVSSEPREPSKSEKKDQAKHLHQQVLQQTLFCQKQVPKLKGKLETVYRSNPDLCIFSLGDLAPRETTVSETNAAGKKTSKKCPESWIDYYNRLRLYENPTKEAIDAHLIQKDINKQMESRVDPATGKCNIKYKLWQTEAERKKAGECTDNESSAAAFAMAEKALSQEVCRDKYMDSAHDISAQPKDVDGSNRIKFLEDQMEEMRSKSGCTSDAHLFSTNDKYRSMHAELEKLQKHRSQLLEGSFAHGAGRGVDKAQVRLNLECAVKAQKEICASLDVVDSPLEVHMGKWWDQLAEDEKDVKNITPALVKGWLAAANNNKAVAVSDDDLMNLTNAMQDQQKWYLQESAQTWNTADGYGEFRMGIDTEQQIGFQKSASSENTGASGSRISQWALGAGSSHAAQGFKCCVCDQSAGEAAVFNGDAPEDEASSGETGHTFATPQQFFQACVYHHLSSIPFGCAGLDPALLDVVKQKALKDARARMWDQIKFIHHHGIGSDAVCRLTCVCARPKCQEALRQHDEPWYEVQKDGKEKLSQVELRLKQDKLNPPRRPGRPRKHAFANTHEDSNDTPPRDPKDISNDVKDRDRLSKFRGSQSIRIARDFNMFNPPDRVNVPLAQFPKTRSFGKGASAVHIPVSDSVKALNVGVWNSTNSDGSKVQISSPKTRVGNALSNEIAYVCFVVITSAMEENMTSEEIYPLVCTAVQTCVQMSPCFAAEREGQRQSMATLFAYSEEIGLGSEKTGRQDDFLQIHHAAVKKNLYQDFPEAVAKWAMDLMYIKLDDDFNPTSGFNIDFLTENSCHTFENWFEHAQKQFGAGKLSAPLTSIFRIKRDYCSGMQTFYKNRESVQVSDDKQLLSEAYKDIRRRANFELARYLAWHIESAMDTYIPKGGPFYIFGLFMHMWRAQSGDQYDARGLRQLVLPPNSKLYHALQDVHSIECAMQDAVRNNPDGRTFFNTTGVTGTSFDTVNDFENVRKAMSAFGQRPKDNQIHAMVKRLDGGQLKHRGVSVDPKNAVTQIHPADGTPKCSITNYTRTKYDVVAKAFDFYRKDGSPDTDLVLSEWLEEFHKQRGYNSQARYKKPIFLAGATGDATVTMEEDDDDDSSSVESDDDELAPIPTPTQEKKRAKRMISKNKPKHTIRDLKRNHAKKTLVSQQGFDTNEYAFSASCNKRLRFAKRHHRINSRIGINPDITKSLVNTRLFGDPQTARRPQIGKPTGLGLVSSSKSQIPQEIVNDHHNDYTNIVVEFHKHMLQFLFNLVDQFPEDNNLFDAPSTVTLELKRKDLARTQRPSTFFIIQEFLVKFYKGPGSTMYKWITVDKDVDCADMVHRAVLLDELLFNADSVKNQLAPHHKQLIAITKSGCSIGEQKKRVGKYMIKHWEALTAIVERLYRLDVVGTIGTKDRAHNSDRQKRKLDETAKAAGSQLRDKTSGGSPDPAAKKTVVDALDRENHSFYNASQNATMQSCEQPLLDPETAFAFELDEDRDSSAGGAPKVVEYPIYSFGKKDNLDPKVQDTSDSEIKSKLFVHKKTHTEHIADNSTTDEVVKSLHTSAVPNPTLLIPKTKDELKGFIMCEFPRYHKVQDIIKILHEDHIRLQKFSNPAQPPVGGFARTDQFESASSPCIVNTLNGAKAYVEKQLEDGEHFAKDYPGLKLDDLSDPLKRFEAVQVREIAKLDKAYETYETYHVEMINSVTKAHERAKRKYECVSAKYASWRSRRETPQLHAEFEKQLQTRKKRYKMACEFYDRGVGGSKLSGEVTENLLFQDESEYNHETKKAQEQIDADWVILDKWLKSTPMLTESDTLEDFLEYEGFGPTAPRLLILKAPVPLKSKEEWLDMHLLKSRQPAQLKKSARRKEYGDSVLMNMIVDERKRHVDQCDLVLAELQQKPDQTSQDLDTINMLVSAKAVRLQHLAYMEAGVQAFIDDAPCTLCYEKNGEMQECTVPIPDCLKRPFEAHYQDYLECKTAYSTGRLRVRSPYGLSFAEVDAKVDPVPIILQKLEHWSIGEMEPENKFESVEKFEEDQASLRQQVRDTGRFSETIFTVPIRPKSQVPRNMDEAIMVAQERDDWEKWEQNDQLEKEKLAEKRFRAHQARLDADMQMAGLEAARLSLAGQLSLSTPSGASSSTQTLASQATNKSNNMHGLNDEFFQSTSGQPLSRIRNLRDRFKSTPADTTDPDLAENAPDDPLFQADQAERAARHQLLHEALHYESDNES